MVGTNTVSIVNASTREVVGGFTILFSILNDGVYDPVNNRFYALDENCLVHELGPRSPWWRSQPSPSLARPSR